MLKRHQRDFLQRIHRNDLRAPRHANQRGNDVVALKAVLKRPSAPMLPEMLASWAVAVWGVTVLAESPAIPSTWPKTQATSCLHASIATAMRRNGPGIRM